MFATAGADGKVRKSFIVQYRRGKQTRRIKLDTANAFTAEQARTAAKAILAKVALGDDPQAERPAAAMPAASARWLKNIDRQAPSVRPASYRAFMPI